MKNSESTYVPEENGLFDEIDHEKKIRKSVPPEKITSDNILSNFAMKKIWLLSFLIIASGITFFFVLYYRNNIASYFGDIFSILQPIIFGLVIAYLISPIVHFFEDFFKKILSKVLKKKTTVNNVSRGLSILLSLLGILSLIGLLGFLVIPELYKSIVKLVNTLPSQLKDFLDWFDTFSQGNSQLAQATNQVVTQGVSYFEDWSKNSMMTQANIAFGYLTAGILGFFKSIMNLIIGMIASIYVLANRETFKGQFKKLIYSSLKASQGNVLLKTLRKSDSIFGRFIIGTLTDSFIIGCICFVVLSILNMPYTLLVSVIVGCTNIIPFFGPYIGAIPSALLILLADPVKGLYFIIFILVLQQIDGNIIAPRIIGNSTGVDPFWVLFSILLFGGLFGVLGMIIAVPSFAVIQYIGTEIIASILKSRKLPTDTESYVQLEFIQSDTNELVYNKE